MTQLPEKLKLLLMTRKDPGGSEFVPIPISPPAYKNKLKVKVAKELIHYLSFFEPRNSVVNDKVANKAIGQKDYGQVWIGIRTDPDPAPRHFYWLSGGPFTSLSYGQWNTG